MSNIVQTTLKTELLLSNFQQVLVLLMACTNGSSLECSGKGNMQYFVCGLCAQRSMKSCIPQLPVKLQCEEARVPVASFPDLLHRIQG